MSTNIPPAQTTISFSRWLRVPLLVLILAGLLIALPWMVLALGVELEPSVMMNMGMITQYLVPIAAFLLLAIWWTFFSRLGWLIRLAGIALVVALFVGFVASVHKVELTTGRVSLVPRFEFAWQHSPQDQLSEYLRNDAPKPDDLPPIEATIGPEDFPAYRGSRTDGVVSFARLETDWTKHPPKILWRHPCGDGYSGVAVAGNIAVTLEQRGTDETIACYDRLTGQPRWAFGYPVYYRDVMGDGPRGTPTIHDGRVYSVGATGELVCLSVEGKKLWSTNIIEDSKSKNIKWGLTGSPLIVDDLVVVNPGIDPEQPAGMSLAAYEHKTGKRRWAVGSRKAGYSSPQLANLGGMRQVLLFDGEGLAGYDPKDGSELWSYPFVTKFEMNSIQPLVLAKDRVFISSESENGQALVRVTPPETPTGKWKVDTVWADKSPRALAARYANPVTDGKSIFGLTKIDGVLTCIDAATGKRLWLGERRHPGQMLLADGVLIVLDGDEGSLHLVAADPTEYRELAQFPVLGYKTWNTPALAGDQLFIRNQREIACVKLARR